MKMIDARYKFYKLFFKKLTNSFALVESIIASESDDFDFDERRANSFVFVFSREMATCDQIHCQANRTRRYLNFFLIEEVMKEEYF